MGVYDPFGSRPTVRRTGWVRVLAGALLVLAGLAAFAAGIAAVVEEGSRIEGDAVARGTVRDGGLGRPVTFDVEGAATRDFTVYALFDGLTSNSVVREVAVRDTGCVATQPGRRPARFRGARQGTSTTIGDASSVGWFSSPAGVARIRCGYTSGTRSSERRRPSALPFVLTPGKPSGFTGSVLLIVGGVAAVLGGGALVWWGWRRRVVTNLA